MTLKDFFTLNELKYGLTNSDRVKELITVMEGEKDFLVNVSQTTRKWSTVATTIAATENKNCLDLFINLDGHFIINKWLKDAQKLQNDNENGDVEELFIALLSALERLQLDNEKVVNSEIGKTVLNLGAHCSSTVREKCKLLCDSWMLFQDDEGSKDPVTKNQKVLDCVESSCKSTVDVEKDKLVKDNLGEKLDVKDEKEINFRDKGELTETLTVSSSLEQIASSADVDNPLQPSSRNTDVLGDKDEEMVDDCESQKVSSNSQGEPIPEPVKDSETLVSQISEVVQESEPDTGRQFSGFDLNQDVYSEEVNNPVNPVYEGSGTHKNSKQQFDFLDFDLNVADCSEEKMERPQLDLNSIEDDRNGWHSPPRSSSSSSKPPLKRNMDLNLNDQHIFPNDASLDHSVISIFGKKVPVKKKDQFIEPRMDFSLGKPNPNPNSNPPFYGHQNGMFFSVPMYGSSHSIPMQMPYVVDSRGAPAPFVPQIIPSQQPSPFIMNMTATGGPHLQQNVDLNTGIMINGGNMEMNGLQQFFPQNVDERYLRPNNSIQVLSNSIVGGKRHEPESRFDFFPVNKHR